MADLIIESLRGGMNNTDPSIFLAKDQCVLAQNVEFVESQLGERRLGTDGIDLPSFLSARDRVPFLFRHLPTADETAAELWALGVSDSPAAIKLGRKTTSWTEITISDTPNVSGFAQYRWHAVSLHGKLHFFYDSNVDRAHTWDGTTMRRSGFTDSIAAPTAADAGSPGVVLAGTRYGRVRVVEVSGSTVVRRSEPGTVLTFAPSGANTTITWTKPTLPGEGETHWEIELSTDNANFYMMSRILIATGTYADTEVYSNGYASGTLSEDAADYTPLWSARYAVADNDRLVIGGSFENEAIASRVGWTPVYGADGVGNDERIEEDTDPTKDLDTYENGPITGISPTVLGGIWVFKQHAIYKMTRTDNRESAYEIDKFTDALGAIHGSVFSGIDEQGNPCIYFMDHEQGPCRIGIGGIKRCGEDLRNTWKTLNGSATAVSCSSLFYPKKKQAMWCLATSASNRPDTCLVLHTDKSRSFPDGVRKGWTLWTGTRATALTMCLYSDNIDDNAARSLVLVPFIGIQGSGLVHRCDTGLTDNATTYAATILTQPYWLKSVQHQFGVRCASIVAKAVALAAIDAKCIRNFGKETTCEVTDISLAPAASETDVIVFLDNFKGAEMNVAQFQFEDITTPLAQWQLNRFDVTEELGTAP